MDNRNDGQGNKAERVLGFNFKNRQNQDEVLVIRNEPPITDSSTEEKEMKIRFHRCGEPVDVTSTKRTRREKKCIIL